MKKQLALCFCASLYLIFLSSCADTPIKSLSAPEPPPKPALYLMSGSHLDEKSWDQVVVDLNAKNFDVIALPRLGREVDTPSHLKQIAELYCARLGARSIVIAHSFAGAFVNEMIGTCPQQIHKVIYVSALVPGEGETAAEQLKGLNQKAYAAAVRFSKDRITPKSPKALFKALDKGISTKEKDLPPVHPEPMLPGQDAIHYDTVEFDKISKFYIFTTEDQIIPLERQKKFASRLKQVSTAEIKSGHLPMFSQPAELARLITEFANR